MTRFPFAAIALVTLALTACGTAGAPAAFGPASQMAAKRVTANPEKLDFTGLKVKSVEGLPVRCPCFKLVAEVKGKTYEVEFETGFSREDVEVQSVKAKNLPR